MAKHIVQLAPGVPTYTNPSSIPVLRTVGDGRVAVWEYIQNGGGGYLWHLMQGADSTSGDWLFGMGIDAGYGNGILIRNKANGIGQKIEQTNQIDSATAYGLTISQDSIAPGMYLELRPTGLAPLFVMQSFQTDQDLKMFTLASATGSVMNVNGYSGLTSWDKNTEHVGGTLTVRSNNGVLAPARKYIKTDATNGVTWHSPSGTDNQWWPFRVNTGGSTWNFQAAGLSGTPDSATFSTLIQIKNNALGFFGSAAVAIALLNYIKNSVLKPLGLAA